jgi:hypothetical protein
MTAAEERSPLAAAPVRVLTERLCEAEAYMGVVGALGVELRRELLARAVARWREDQAAPTFRAAGLGVVSLTVPQTRVVVADADEFASWVAETHPTEAVTRVVVDDVPPEQLEAVLDAVRGVVDELTAHGKVTAAVEARPAYVKRLLEHDCTVVEAAPGEDGVTPPPAVFDNGSGTVIAGVKVIAGADPTKESGPEPTSITVRLESQAKADAAAQASARLADVITSGLAALSPAGPSHVAVPAELLAAVPPEVLAAAEVVDDAHGAPDDDDLCGCGHARRPPNGKSHLGHGGKTGAGKCRVPGCDCPRFRAPAVVW